MRKRNLKTCMLMAVSLWALSSCVNSEYDLSDIDTNVRLTVNDLVVPVRIAPMALDDVIDIEEGDRIKKVEINGKEMYAVVEQNWFESGTVDIAPISIHCPTMDPINKTLDLEETEKFRNIPERYLQSTFKEIRSLGLAGMTDQSVLLTLQISDAKQEISFSAEGIDPAIVSVKHIGVDAMFKISLTFKGVNNVAKSYEVNNLTVHLPKGLETTNEHYNKETGLVKYDRIKAGDDLKVEIELPLVGIEQEKAGFDSDLSDHKFSFAEKVWASGELTIQLGDFKDDAKVIEAHELKSVDYTCQAAIDNDIKVTKFSGHVRYQLDRPEIDPVNLNDLPELFTQEGTEVEINNPQIYVSVNNPVSRFNVTPTVDFQLVPNRDNDRGPFKQTIVLEGNRTMLCLSPKKPAQDELYRDKIYDYSAAKWQEFANLGSILRCQENGESKVPTELEVYADPKIDQEVEDFEPGHFDAVEGNYTFVAPLEFSKDTKICYAKTWDDWADDDLDGLTIVSGSISATLTTDIPMGVKVTATLLGRDASGNTVRLEGEEANVPAKAKDYTLNIKIQGQPISRIYGLDLRVRAVGDDTPLSPAQKVEVSNVKAKVSGYYDKEL